MCCQGRNNKSIAHENGSIGSSAAISVRDALLLRGTKAFDDLGSCRRGNGGVRRLPLLGARDGPLGHQLKLIAPRYVKALQKNDAAGCEAIVEAAQPPTMRFVETKMEEQAVSVRNVSRRSCPLRWCS